MAPPVARSGVCLVYREASVCGVMTLVFGSQRSPELGDQVAFLMTRRASGNLILPGVGSKTGATGTLHETWRLGSRVVERVEDWAQHCSWRAILVDRAAWRVHGRSTRRRIRAKLLPQPDTMSPRGAGGSPSAKGMCSIAVL
jgi:hypothetical protein